MGNSLGMKNKSSGNITSQFEEAYQQWKAGSITAVKAIAIELSNIGKSILYRSVKKYKEVIKLSPETHQAKKKNTLKTSKLLCLLVLGAIYFLLILF